MSIPAPALAQRLKNAREAMGFTQAEAAKAVGLSRTALALVELGKRRVEVGEVGRLIRLYELPIHEVFKEDAPRDPLPILFRASTTLDKDVNAKRQVLHARKLAKEIGFYEGLAGGPAQGVGFRGYDVGTPSTKGEAIEQGQALAARERARLGLGLRPVWELPEILRGEGLRVVELKLPKAVFGLTLRLEEGGVLVAVNRDHAVERRLFSYAHELCHVVADQAKSATVSAEPGKKEPAETRADVFAADFLMPQEGVLGFLKGSLGRLFKGKLSGSHWPEAAQLARYFAVSYQAAVYRLNNLDLVSDEIRDQWLKDGHPGYDFKRQLKGSELKEAGHQDLESQLVEAGLRALRAGKISRRKFIELCQQGGLKDEAQVDALVESAVGGPALHDAVGPW